jgi:DOPA 4,5-dioxygenase
MENDRGIAAEGYHVHFYCELSDIERCNVIRSKFVDELKGVDGVGPVRTKGVGPHPLPMFEAWFALDLLDTVVRWAMLNRQGLSVMFHPLTGDDLVDHRDHAFWLGRPLPLRLEIFE